MAAFVGEMDSYKMFEWACEAGICKEGDEVRRMILDIGIDDVVIVHIEKYTDNTRAQVRLPEIRNVQNVATGTTLVTGVVDGVLVRGLTPLGRELRAFKEENAELREKLVEATKCDDGET